MKILTNQKQIPWSWAAIVLFPWFAMSFREVVTNAGMTFTLKKFVDDPAIIGLVLSTNSAFGLLVGSVVAFLSDYIWTPFGRRRPFLLISFFGAAFLSLFVPFASTAWAVIAIIVFYQFVVDFCGSYEPFTMDVIPAHQRGRGGAMAHWYKTIASAAAMYLLIGNFDRIYEIGGFQINGEKAMYWANSLSLALAGCLVLFFVKEQKPANYEKRSLKKLLVQRFVKELTQPTMLRILGLALTVQTVWLGIGQFETLLITEQWGYEKSEYGNVTAASMLVTLALVPIAGFLSDKVNRMSLLKIGLYCVLGLKSAFYIYFEFFLVGQPPLSAVFAIGLAKSTIGSFMAVACVPILFDYVPRAKVGTLGCGLGIVFALSAFVSTNVMGNWIKFASPSLFNLPDGVYNYFAAYQWVILCTAAGIVYLHIFMRAVKRGLIKKAKIEDDAPEASAAN